MSKKRQLQILNEVGSYAVFDEMYGNEVTSQDSGIELEDEEEEK